MSLLQERSHHAEQGELQEGSPGHHISGIKQLGCRQTASNGKRQQEAPGTHTCLCSVGKESWKSPQEGEKLPRGREVLSAVAALFGK